MNNFKNIASTTVLRSDLLSTTANLRYNKQPNYESHCPGFLSIIIVFGFAAIFINTFLDVLKLQDITAFEHLSSNLESADPIQDLMFAMGIEGLDNSVFSKYFLFQFTQISISKGTNGSKTTTTTQIPMSNCDVKYWSDLNIPSMTTIFSLRGFSSLFCPNSTFIVQGTSYQDDYKYVEVKLKPCEFSSNPNCINNTNARETFMNNFITSNDYFSVKLYIKDTIISPTQEEPTTNVIESDVLITFSTTTGTIGNFKIADYQIDTDTSILPWTDYDTQSGYFLQRFQTSTIPTSNRWLYLRIDKSTKKFTVQRQYGKLDDMLSYVGGLFGLIFVVIQFFMSSYNTYRYQLSIGQVLFQYDEHGDQVKPDELSFWTYIKYVIYDWMDFFGCAPQCWESMKRIHQTRQESNQQIDVRYLMKKIRYLENVAQILTTEDQRIGLLLTELPSMKRIQKMRKFSQFYTKLFQQQQNGEDYLINKRLSLEKGLELTQGYAKRVIPQSSMTLQNENGQQKTRKQTLFGEQNISSHSDNSDSNFIDQVSQAILRLNIQKSDPLNRKIVTKLPENIIKKLSTRRVSLQPLGNSQERAINQGLGTRPLRTKSNSRKFKHISFGQENQGSNVTKPI